MRFVRLDSCALVVCWIGLLTTCAMSQEAAKQPEGAPAVGGMAASTTPLCQCIGDVADSPTKAQIEQALREPLRTSGLDFTEQSLQEVATFLSDEYRIPIGLDMQALSEAGIQPDEPITVNLQHISLQSALRLMLKAHQATYIVRDEVLLMAIAAAARWATPAPLPSAGSNR